MKNHNDSTFLDDDECLLGTSNCSQLCDNTPGSFNCLCRAGFSLSQDGITCDGMYVRS